jgi:hypothetical protein
MRTKYWGKFLQVLKRHGNVDENSCVTPDDLILSAIIDLYERTATTNSEPQWRDVTLEFDCPRWPGCGCPDGTTVPECPGTTKMDLPS